MTTMMFVVAVHGEKRQNPTLERAARGSCRALSYRVIDAPHKHAEQRLVRAEQLNLLMLHPEVFLLQLAEPAGYLRYPRHACCDCQLAHTA